VIIGAIERVRPNRVTGWIHCHAADLKDATVLAFVDRRCVGTGKVGLFRQDLADAGLLHGHLGFDFPISLDTPEDTGKVVVSLERCEAVIVQHESVVRPKRALEGLTEAPRLGARLPGPELTAWLRTQGAVSAAEAEILEGLTDFGVAIWQPEDDAGPAGRAQLPAKAAARLFSICTMMRVDVGDIELNGPEHLTEALAATEGDLPAAGLIAFHAARPVRLRVLEGSHKRRHVPEADDPAPAPEPATHGLEYPVGPDALLLLHRDCRFASDEFGPNRRLRVLYPKRSEAA
jgi:hypothetical protein